MLPPQLTTYLRNFDRVKRNARALTIGLSEEQFNWRPGEGRWSVGECFEHCNIIAERTLPAVRTAIHHAREFGPFGEGPFTYGVVSRLFIRSVRPTGVRMRTPPSYVPPPSTHDRDETVNRFISLQDEWMDVIRASEGLNLRRVRVPSPAFPMLRLGLGAWYEATPLHELRHLEQAQRVMQSPGFPVGE